MPRARCRTMLVVLALFATACSGSDSQQQIQSVEITPEETDSSTGSASGSSAGETTTTVDQFGDLTGLIVTTGPTGLRILEPTGAEVATFAENLVVAHPTWSRDARHIVATFIDPEAGISKVGFIDTATWELTLHPAARPYFFYTWNYDGTLVAALGPTESSSDTTVDILETDGTSITDEPIFGGSMYVAWEPGGTDLLLHAGPNLILLNDLRDVTSAASLGQVGQEFLAGSWIPGTRDFLYVDSIGDSSRLIRRSADTGEPTDLGEAGLGDTGGISYIAVHPDGTTAALGWEPPPESSNGTQESAGGTSTLIAASSDESRLIQDSVPFSEMVDLETGERSPITDGLTLWLEWSPDGTNLMMANFDSGQIAWLIWDGEEARELFLWDITVVFFQRYMRFAGQMTEAPRLWSPDGGAFTYAALIEGAPVAAVTLLDGSEVVPIGDAEVAFWSPVAPPS